MSAAQRRGQAADTHGLPRYAPEDLDWRKQRAARARRRPRRAGRRRARSSSRRRPRFRCWRRRARTRRSSRSRPRRRRRLTTATPSPAHRAGRRTALDRAARVQPSTTSLRAARARVAHGHVDRDISRPPAPTRGAAIRRVRPARVAEPVSERGTGARGPPRPSPRSPTKQALRRRAGRASTGWHVEPAARRAGSARSPASRLGVAQQRLRQRPVARAPGPETTPRSRPQDDSSARGGQHRGCAAVADHDRVGVRSRPPPSRTSSS